MVVVRRPFSNWVAHGYVEKMVPFLLCFSAILFRSSRNFLLSGESWRDKSISYEFL